MSTKYLPVTILTVIFFSGAAGLFILKYPSIKPTAPHYQIENKIVIPITGPLASSIPENQPATPEITHVGPRDNLPVDAPTAYGFWSFAYPVNNILSRSGQPLLSEFAWLKENGWHSVVNLRVDGERGEVGDDVKIPGFSELGLNYLHLPIIDGHPPTNEQAKLFLDFVSNPKNQPVHVHCRGGIGRAGTMTALYRYQIQQWPLEEAIAESRPFKGGISTLQENWLRQWAKNNHSRL